VLRHEGAGAWSMSAARRTQAVTVDASCVYLEERVEGVGCWELEVVPRSRLRSFFLEVPKILAIETAEL
jgi:hypothetical protein